jgi:ABC-type transport system substrate-binding protein
MNSVVPLLGSVLRGKLLRIFLIFAACGFWGCTLKNKAEPPNTLHLVAEEKVKGLDPIFADDLYSGNQVGQVYEGLLQYHYLKRPYVLVPNLAESLPEVSQDRLTYKFHLKKGVLFQDDKCFKATHGKGREMTADDVVYSFKRIADPRLASLGWWLFDGKLLGLNEWRDRSSTEVLTHYNQMIEGLKALDKYTVQFKLIRPSSQFLYAFAMPFTGIVPHEAVEEYGREFLNHPVGTGPFKLSEYNPSSKIVWDRNPNYRDEFYPQEGAPGDQEAGLLADAGKKLPLSDRIIIDVFVERQPMWLNFLSGKIDVTAIPKDNFSSAITPSKELTPELSARGIRLVKSAEIDVTHLSFNMADPLLGQNKYLRQALSLAYDEGTFIELFFNGRAIQAQGPIPPGVSGYDPELKNPYRQFNLARAKDYLAKAGYPEGKGLPSFEYATTADSVGRQEAEYLQKIMAPIGVKIEVSSYSWPQFQEAIRNKKGQLWMFAWQADYPDAENFLQLFYSKNSSPGPNDSNYSNKQYDLDYEQSLLLPDGPQRTELYKKMVKLLVEDCPWIFGAHRLGYALTQPWLKNYKVSDFDHSRYKYYRVDSQLKK